MTTSASLTGSKETRRDRLNRFIINHTDQIDYEIDGFERLISALEIEEDHVTTGVRLYIGRYQAPQRVFITSPYSHNRGIQVQWPDMIHTKPGRYILCCLDCWGVISELEMDLTATEAALVLLGRKLDDEERTCPCQRYKDSESREADFKCACIIS